MLLYSTPHYDVHVRLNFLVLDSPYSIPITIKISYKQIIRQKHKSKLEEGNFWNFIGYSCSHF